VAADPTKPSSAAAGGGSQTLERGLRVLRVLAAHPAGLSVTEIAAELGTHRPSVYRLLAPLTDQRLVSRGEDGRYTLGVGLVELSSSVRPRLQEVALPELRRLADDLRATAALTVRDGDEAVVFAVMEPRSTDMHIAYRTGLRHPLDRAAAGLAILAGGAPRAGERDAVGQARERGWARSTGEILPGASGVAAPIARAGRDAEASLSVVWIEPRDEAPVAERVVASARAIAAALG
jgi:DNA-binding IclR family transcriptional regulator